MSQQQVKTLTLLLDSAMVMVQQIFLAHFQGPQPPPPNVQTELTDMWKNNCAKTVDDQSLVCNITVLDFRYLAQFQNRSGSKANGIEK